VVYIFTHVRAEVGTKVRGLVKVGEDNEDEGGKHEAGKKPGEMVKKGKHEGGRNRARRKGLGLEKKVHPIRARRAPER